MPTFEFDIQGNEIQVEAANEREALSKALTALGQQGGQPPAQEAPQTFRERFAAGMGQVARPVAGAVSELARLSGALREALPGQPRQPVQAPSPQDVPQRTYADVAGEAAASLVPRTPEGVALTAAPVLAGLGPAAGTLGRIARVATGAGAPRGNILRPLGTYPALGAGTALATGGAREDIAAGAGQGLVVGGAQALTAGAQRFGRRLSGKELSVRNIEAQAAQEVDMANRVSAGLEADLGMKLEGKTAGERLIRAPKVIQDLISTDYGRMQQGLERGLQGRTLTLPRLAAIRGETTTIPGSPGQPAVPLLGPQGQPLPTGRAGTPSRQVLNTSFTPREALDAIKDFGVYTRRASRTAAGEPKGGEPMTGRELRLENRAVRAELAQELIRQGRPDLAAQFQESSSFYAKGLRGIDLVEAAIKGKALRGGGPQEGGVAEQAFRDILVAEGVVDDFPWTTAAAQRGTPVGAREIGRPSFEPGGVRGYAGPFGLSPRLPATTIPVGTGFLSPRPGPTAALGANLGVEGLLRDKPPLGEKPERLKTDTPMVE